MTAQIAEKLHYEGQHLSMCSEPLRDYFALGGLKPGFQSNCTALWRGYVGTWEILIGRLYLVELRGTLEGGEEASVGMLFPDFPDRAFAHWYSGTIRVPQGRMLKYVHMGYASTYERDLFLDFEKGVVTSTRVRKNGVAASDDASEGYRIGAMTTLPPRRKDSGDAS